MGGLAHCDCQNDQEENSRRSKYVCQKPIRTVNFDAVRFTNQLAEMHTADLELLYKFGTAEKTGVAVRNAYYACPNY